jgi:RNA polymerase sigma factor for flagellar operon FliA
MHGALERLPEREQRMIRGHYFEGRRFDDVAAELGISKSWASRVHAHALDLLRKALAGADNP